MEWTEAHAVLVHLKKIELPRAEEGYKMAGLELIKAKEEKMNDKIRQEILERKINFKMKVDRVQKAIIALSELQIGDIDNK